jgi:hypothetical protein
MNFLVLIQISVVGVVLVLFTKLKDNVMVVTNQSDNTHLISNMVEWFLADVATTGLMLMMEVK